jgi:hypothetical protein
MRFELYRVGASFAELLDRVSQIDPEMRIRFTSPHPKDFPQEVLPQRQSIQTYIYRRSSPETHAHTKTFTQTNSEFFGFVNDV